MKPFEQAKDEIARLVKHFATNHEAYRAPAYKEAHARQEFMDPFFAALGWDVHNAQQLAPDYREVVIEDTVEIQGQKKAPDYVFRVGRDRKFFAEAKKPGVDLKKDSGPAYQLRRYAWTAKLPLSLLTDFEELAVYDCRARPFDNDKASTGRVNYYAFEEYPDRWREIWDVFSREAVWGGSFDQYVQAGRGKRGTSEVDAEFLKEIENWRDALARNMALRNPRLTIDELNDAVQRTIDRIIFLRMAEDRGIEDYGRLSRLADGDDIYKGLVALFRHADARYNSGLFDFSRGSGGDPLTPGLKADDKVLKPILTSLYFPQSPYEFSVLPVEILGDVYEQFLGKVIRLTAAHQAKVEEKPEVKKAGGVKYTPAYIVNYIVRNTLGKWIEANVEANSRAPFPKPFRVLDMACGSGSFLLGAYQYLLDYYLHWYTEHEPEKWTKAVYAGPNGEWRLTTAEKKRILLNHIYGVDIDRQAVEVAKLSLLLKVLETESDESLGRQLALFHEEAKERALPNLDRNIKCGNSLIGPDYFSGHLMPDDDELKRVNPFDWAKEFPQVMKPAARALWFATFVTHNSRVSERMLTYGVQTGEPLIFSPEDQVLIAEKIFETCRQEGIAVVAANVLPDHVHLVVAAEDEKTLEEHIRKIKGASSFAFQRARGWEKGSHQHVWAQKFHRAPIAGQTALTNILEYVHNNHLKHVERWGETLITTWDKGLKPLVRAGCVSVEEACQPRGGFDCVIGNPPYIRIQMMKEWASLEVEIYKQLYTAASSGNYDIYVVFVEKGLSLLNARGRLGFILPHKFFNAQYGEPLRALLSEGKQLSHVVHFGDQQVFAGATTYTCLMFLDKAGSDECRIVKVDDLAAWRRTGTATEGAISADNITAAEWNFAVGEGAALFEKLGQMPVKLGDVADIFVGLQTSADTVFLFKDVPSSTGKLTRVHSKELDEDILIESELLKPVVRSGEIGRYWASPTAYVLFPYHTENGKARLIPENDFKKKYPRAWGYLSQNKQLLAGREHGKFKDTGWYQLYPKNLDLWEQPKILMPYMITELSAYYDTGDMYFVNVTTGGFGVRVESKLGVLAYFTGLLNSRLLNWFFKQVSTTFHGGYFAANKQFLVQLPIRLINFSDTADKTRHDRMVKLIEQMLDLHKRLAAAQDAGERERLQRLIDSTDQQIDALVYELYGLTPEEIEIVEGPSGATFPQSV